MCILDVTMAFLLDPDRLEAEFSKAEWSIHLPWLIRTLIRQSAGPSATINALVGRDGSQPGFDLEVEASKAQNVPGGLSIWEVSTDKGMIKKADGDIRKRSQKVAVDAQKETTYIAVSTRKFSSELKRKEWARIQMEKSSWKAVEFIDFRILHEWIESLPHVAMSLATRLGLGVAGVFDLEQWMTNFNHGRRTKVLPDWFTSGRGGAKEELVKLLRSGEQTVGISGPSHIESIIFLWSCLTENRDDKGDELLGKILVATDKTAFKEIASTVPNAIVLPVCVLDPVDYGSVLTTVRLILPSYSGSLKSVVEVNPVSSFKLAERMREAGVEFDLATEAGRAARRSFNQFSKVVGDDAPALSLPQFAKSFSDVTLGLVLANRWKWSNSIDVEFLCQLCAATESQIRSVERALGEGDNPIIRKIENISYVTILGEAISTCESLLSSTFLNRFADLTLTILAAREASNRNRLGDANELSGPEHPLAHASDELLSGLCRTLTILSDSDVAVASLRPSQVAREIVRTLLADATCRRWDAMGPFLPDLAEAGPEEFLDALEQDLERTEPKCLGNPVREGKLSSYMSSKHHNLLWALEGLAWSPKYIYRSSKALMRLTMIFGGDVGGNHPMSSLREIFLAWHPSTSASLEERKSIILKLNRDFPNTTGQLLLNLLPSLGGGEVARGTYRPRFRAFGASPGPQLHTEIVEFHWFVFDELLESSSGDLVKLADLSTRVVDRDGFALNKVLDRISDMSLHAIDEEARLKAWEKLRELYTVRSRQEPEWWVLPEESLRRLRVLLEVLEPHSKVHRHLWKFGHGLHLSDIHSDELLQEQTKALDDIAESGGVRALEQLIKLAEYPGFVGRSLALSSVLPESTIDELVGEWLNDESEQSLKICAYGVVDGRVSSYGQCWLINLIGEASRAGWNPDSIASLYLRMPISLSTWDDLEREREEVVRAYWENVWHYGPFLGSKRAVEKMRASLAGVGRYIHSLEFLSYQIGNAPLESWSDLIASALDDICEAGMEAKRWPGSSIYALHTVFKRLIEENRIPCARIARYEFRLLEAFEFGYVPTAIEALLASDPAFLLELIEMAYPNDSGEIVGLNGQNGALSRTVLKSWHAMPCSEDGIAYEVTLKSWFNRLNELASSRHYNRALLDVMGCLVGNSDPGEDGVWPTEPASALLEHIDSSETFEACWVTRWNSRGVIGRALDSGGDMERGLVRQYNAWAERRKSYPGTRAMLLELANGYESSAKRRDIESAKTQEL